jgi:di/tripeptidase
VLDCNYTAIDHCSVYNKTVSQYNYTAIDHCSVYNKTVSHYNYTAIDHCSVYNKAVSHYNYTAIDHCSLSVKSSGVLELFIVSSLSETFWLLYGRTVTHAWSFRR